MDDPKNPTEPISIPGAEGEPVAPALNDSQLDELSDSMLDEASGGVTTTWGTPS